MNEYNRMTVGLDIGDKMSEICLLDSQGIVVERKRIASTPDSLKKYFGGFAPLLVVLESGFHSPWMSRVLKELKHEVIVANSRRIALIAKNWKKSDTIDAELLARLGRSDLELLSPVEHRSESLQLDMSVVRARDALVRSRTLMVNHVRGVVKSHGARLRSTGAKRFHKLEEQIPVELKPALASVMSCIEHINARITELDKEIEALCAKHPATEMLRSIPGVGPVTALVFVLVVMNPKRFSRNRNVGAYLGLVPRKHQSGDEDPELRITRAGNIYMRRLLVNAAHYVLGPFGPDCELRRFGLAIAARGKKRAKKKAAVATARRIAVLMNSLWKRGEFFQPFPSTKPETCASAGSMDTASESAPDGRDTLMGVASARPAPVGRNVAQLNR